MVKDYAQLPQKPIRLKPRIAMEMPSASTRHGPPAEILREQVSPGQRRQVKRKTKRQSDQWTIRGVSPEIREAVALAAKGEGMTIGAWVDEVLRDAFEAEPAAAPQLEASQEILEVLDEIRARLEVLEGRRTFWETLTGFWG